MDGQLDDVRARIASYVSYWRAHAGMSIADAVSASGVSRSKWSEIENGKGDRPKPETLGAIARAIERDPADLLAIVGLEAPTPPRDGGTEQGAAAAVAEIVERLDVALQRLEGRVQALERSVDLPDRSHGESSPRAAQQSPTT